MNAEDPLFLVGTLLEKKYRVERFVAAGGFGVVYAGTHLGLDIPVAIKILRADAETDPERWQDLLAQFLQEAKTLARLRHPAIVEVLDAGVAFPKAHPAGAPWMVMRWLEGRTLQEDLDGRRGMGGRSREETLALLGPVLEAVAEAHDAGVAHRDLKPANIMLVTAKGGRTLPYVLDFGIAKLMAEEENAPGHQTETRSGKRAFTAAWAAPEQLSGTRSGPWTDVHALGLLLTAVLTDESPYPTESTEECFQAVFREPRPTPARLGKNVGIWEPIFEKALALKPQDRFPHARQLLRALRDESSPLEATELAHEAPEPKLRRKARLAQVTVLGSLLVVLGAFLAFWRSREPEKIAPPACTTRKECTERLLGPALCQPSIGCVRLESEDCTLLASDTARNHESTIWFGSLLPKTGEDALAHGLSNVRAMELALSEFDEVAKSLTDPETKDAVPPFGIVSCDDVVSPHRAARHLAERLHLPAVIGFRSSVEAIDLENALLIPREILSLAALNTNPLVTQVPHPKGGPRLVFRTTYTSRDTANALGAFVGEVLEPKIRTLADGPRPEDPLRVVLLRPKNAAGAGFSEALFGSLRFNGKSTLENGDRFRELTFDADKEPSETFPPMVGELLDIRPHVILYAATRSVIRDLFAVLEAQWPKHVRHRPRYASLAMLPQEVLAFVGTDAGRRRRFFGTTTVSTTEANARFVLRYNEVYPDKITRTIAPNSSYDAVYILAYAAWTIGKGKSITGPALANGIEQLLPPGRPLPVGMTHIYEAFSTLRQGSRIDLEGATGKLDFDVATGEPNLAQAILCVGVGQRGEATDGIESGLVYESGTRKLLGTMNCP